MQWEIINWYWIRDIKAYFHKICRNGVLLHEGAISFRISKLLDERSSWQKVQIFIKRRGTSHFRANWPTICMRKIMWSGILGSFVLVSVKPKGVFDKSGLGERQELQTSKEEFHWNASITRSLFHCEQWEGMPTTLKPGVGDDFGGNSCAIDLLTCSTQLTLSQENAKNGNSFTKLTSSLIFKWAQIASSK